MRVTTELLIPPYACLVTGREDGEMCDFEVEVPPYGDGEIPHLYIKRDVVESAAKELGMAPVAEVAELRQQLAEFGERLDAVLDDVSLLADFEDKFNTTVRSASPDAD
jgi:hypothetical protein